MIAIEVISIFIVFMTSMAKWCSFKFYMYQQLLHCNVVPMLCLVLVLCLVFSQAEHYKFHINFCYCFKRRFVTHISFLLGAYVPLTVLYYYY